MNTITAINDYKDVFVYGFICAIAFFLWAIHKYLERRRDQKETEKLFYSKEERNKRIRDALL